MLRSMGLVIAALMCLTHWGCYESASNVAFISIDFPHGGTRLHVWSDGRAALFYGARPQYETVKNGTFDIEQLYRHLRPRLHPNVPREDWPNPSSTAGMVQISFEGKGRSVYLIFDEHEYTQTLFQKAKNKITGSNPL